MLRVGIVTFNVSTKTNSHQSLDTIITACKKGERRYQQFLYQRYYSFAMSICLRYSNNYQEAVEILNDGFLKVFTKLAMYNPQKSFKGWVRRIMINSAIDHYRKEQKHSRLNSLDNHDAVSANPTVIQ